jgi:amino acid transporter
MIAIGTPSSPATAKALLKTRAATVAGATDDAIVEPIAKAPSRLRANAVARYTFALGREGVLPRVLGRTTRKGAPRNASLVQTALAFDVLVLYAVAGWDPLVQLFYWGSTSGGLGVLLLITVTSIAVIGFFARDTHGETLWHRLIAPLLATGILLVVSWLAVDNLATLFGVEPGTGPAKVVPTAFLVIFAAGTGWGLILRRARPQIYLGIGRGTRSAVAAPSGLSGILTERHSR